jgi:outer membrane receptor protein involved in Fe transport
VGYGNPELRPEDAWLNDVGLSFERVFDDAWRVNAKLDGFCNLLKDKIISAPSELDPYIWLPYNIGRVRSLGVDAVAGFGWHRDDWTAGLNARYSWQSAVDVTGGSETYGKPVPYIAKHTFVIDAKLAWKELELHPVWMMRAGRSDGYGELPSWSTLDLRLAKRFAFGKGGAVSLWVTAKNLLDCRYELVTGYPMPGRSFLGGVEYKF